MENVVPAPKCPNLVFERETYITIIFGVFGKTFKNIGNVLILLTFWNFDAVFVGLFL